MPTSRGMRWAPRAPDPAVEKPYDPGKDISCQDDGYQRILGPPFSCNQRYLRATVGNRRNYSFSSGIFLLPPTAFSELFPYQSAPQPGHPCGATPKKILDLGTGTGCILISLLKEYPKAHGIGVDISVGALQVAEKNSKELGVSERVQWRHGSWLDPVQGMYDCIVSNPPYIPQGTVLDDKVTLWDPQVAFYAGPPRNGCLSTNDSPVAPLFGTRGCGGYGNRDGSGGLGSRSVARSSLYVDVRGGWFNRATSVRNGGYLPICESLH